MISSANKRRVSRERSAFCYQWCTGVRVHIHVNDADDGDVDVDLLQAPWQRRAHTIVLLSGVVHDRSFARHAYTRAADSYSHRCVQMRGAGSGLVLTLDAFVPLSSLTLSAWTQPPSKPVVSSIVPANLFGFDASVCSTN